jgi:hypothetical protein
MPQDRPTRPPRPLNPRRILLKHVRELKAVLLDLVQTWDVRGTVYDRTAEERPRQPDEYPENSLDQWRYALRAARYVSLHAEDLARYAAEQIQRIERENQP